MMGSCISVNQCVDAAAIFSHVHLVAIHGGRGGQQVMLQMLLGHILDLYAGCQNLRIPGIVLNQALHISAIDASELIGLGLGDNDLNVIFQESVAIIGADFGCGVAVILHTLDDDLTGRASRFHRDKVGGYSFLGSMTDHIVHTLGLVQLGNDVVVVGIVVDQELNILEVACAVREQLGQVNAIGVEVTIVHQSIKVVGIRAHPGQDYIVGVAGIVVDHGCIGIHGSLISDVQGAVGVS